jgi:hypothetical protein
LFVFYFKNICYFSAIVQGGSKPFGGKAFGGTKAVSGGTKASEVVKELSGCNDTNMDIEVKETDVGELIGSYIK